MSDTDLRLRIGEETFTLAVADGAAGASLAAMTPVTIRFSRWGDEFYGALPQPLSVDTEPAQDVYDVGDVAYWPPGDALCVFFGPTPASHGDEPRMASPGVLLGTLSGDIAALRSMGSATTAVLS